MPLTPKTLAAEWKEGKFRPVYFLFGEDGGSKLAAVDALRKRLALDAFNSSELAGDDDAAAAELVSACATPPMFAEHRLVVARGVSYGAGARRLIADYLRDPLPSTVLVLVSPEPKPDPKDALAAAAEALGGVVLFKALDEREAAARLVETARREGFELEPAAADLLVEEAGSAWGILRAELEKIKLFTAGKGKAGTAEVEACLGYRRETSPFDLPRALQRRDAARALALTRALLSEGGEPFRLLNQITRTVSQQLRAKRMVKAGVTPDQIFRELRLQKYYDRDYLPVAAKVGEPALLRSLRACLDAEVALKSRSWLEPRIELEQLVLTVCGK